MKLGRGGILGLFFVAASLLVTLALYRRLPDPVPTHWNASMKANGWTAKPWGALLGPILLAALWILFWILPRISPRGFRFDSFGGVWQILQAAILGALFVITSVALLAATGAAIPLERVVGAALGLLLMVLGIFMGKLTKNFFVGIRTPWTLASDEVWFKTHQLGGKLFAAAGAALLVTALAGLGLVIGMAALGAAAVVSVVYSYLVYKRTEGFQDRVRP